MPQIETMRGCKIGDYPEGQQLELVTAAIVLVRCLAVSDVAAMTEMESAEVPEPHGTI